MVNKKALFSIVFVIASCLVFFSKGIIFDKKTIIWDAADQFFPSLWYTGHLWKAGFIPLWNPFIFNGYPVFADIQNQTFYPPNIIISFIHYFSAKTVYIQLVLHYLLAGIFMYFFAGFYIKNNTGRLISSVVYMFSGFMVNHAQHLTIINSVVWLPLILFFLEKGWRQENILYFFPAGLSTALLILAGHPQTTLSIFYIIFAFTVFKTFSREKKFSLFPSGLVVASMVFGILLAAVQILPTMEFSSLSNRGGPLPYWLIIWGQFYPANLVTLLLPDYFGVVGGPYSGVSEISHSLIYCGVVFLVALPFTLMKKDKEAYFFIFMALISILISLGDYGGIFKFFYNYMPGFNLFRSPAHYRFAFTFFAAILSGIGIGRILEGNGLKRTMGSFSLKALNGILLSVVFLDFYVHGAGALSIGAKTNHREIQNMPPVINTLKKQTLVKKSRPFLTGEELQNALYRVYADDGMKKHEAFYGFLPYDFSKLRVVGFNRPVIQRIFMTDGYNPMVLKRYTTFSTSLRDRNYGNFLMLSNVKYIIGPAGVKVLDDGNTLKRAYMVNEALYVKEPDKVLDMLSGASFNPANTAVIEEPLNEAIGENCNGKVKITEYLPHKVELEAESGCASFVVLSDAYYPGWKLKVDSAEEKDPVRTNYLFRGVPVPKGKHHVVFEFKPRSFRAGLIISAASLFSGICAFFLIKTSRKVRKTSAK